MGVFLLTAREFLRSVLLQDRARIVFATLACFLFLSPAQSAEPVLPLVLETTIALPNVGGRIDHLAVDLARKRLFVAEVGNNTLDAIDMATQKLVHRIAGLN